MENEVWHENNSSYLKVLRFQIVRPQKHICRNDQLIRPKSCSTLSPKTCKPENITCVDGGFQTVLTLSEQAGSVLCRRALTFTTLVYIPIFKKGHGVKKLDGQALSRAIQPPSKPSLHPMHTDNCKCNIIYALFYTFQFDHGGQMNKASYGVACPQLKTISIFISMK